MMKQEAASPNSNTSANEEALLSYHGKYSDIIACDRPRHDSDDFSVRHPSMTISHRAKLFKPFAALNGFDEAIAEKNIVYLKRSEHSELRQQQVNRVLTRLEPLCRTQRDCRINQVHVDITCFCQVELPIQDVRNDGDSVYGFYETISGVVRQLDLISQTVCIRTAQDGKDRDIPFADIERLRCHAFESGGQVP
ncbi:MAG: hypothetical protein IJ899_16315 [Blautia sp.]|nr:hypothetical protein [Blautia sp.]